MAFWLPVFYYKKKSFRLPHRLHFIFCIILHVECLSVRLMQQTGMIPIKIAYNRHPIFKYWLSIRAKMFVLPHRLRLISYIIVNGELGSNAYNRHMIPNHS